MRSSWDISKITTIITILAGIATILWFFSEKVWKYIKSTMAATSELGLLEYFRQVWGFREDDTVYIICPELEYGKERQEPEPGEYLYLGKYGDIDSLLVIFAFLTRIYPSLKIRFYTSEEFKKLPGTPYANNLIIIGGPDYNSVAAEFLYDDTLGIPFMFVEEGEDVVLKNKKTGEIFKSSFKIENNHEKVIDYGFFLKIPNPRNPAKKLIMISGIHTYGVFGTAKAFSIYDEDEIEIAKNNCKRVVEKLGKDPFFGVVVKVECIDKRVFTPVIQENKIIKFET